MHSNKHVKNPHAPLPRPAMLPCTRRVLRGLPLWPTASWPPCCLRRSARRVLPAEAGAASKGAPGLALRTPPPLRVGGRRRGVRGGWRREEGDRERGPSAQPRSQRSLPGGAVLASALGSLHRYWESRRCSGFPIAAAAALPSHQLRCLLLPPRRAASSWGTTSDLRAPREDKRSGRGLGRRGGRQQDALGASPASWTNFRAQASSTPSWAGRTHQSAVQRQ